MSSTENAPSVYEKVKFSLKTKNVLTSELSHISDDLPILFVDTCGVRDYYIVGGASRAFAWMLRYMATREEHSIPFGTSVTFHPYPLGEIYSPFAPHRASLNVENAYAHSGPDPSFFPYSGSVAFHLYHKAFCVKARGRISWDMSFALDCPTYRTLFTTIDIEPQLNVRIFDRAEYRAFIGL